MGRESAFGVGNFSTYQHSNILTIGQHVSMLEC